ncbi:hypothetical protein BDV96DRAFT_676715, partial [Lophiotrema nucula]
MAAHHYHDVPPSGSCSQGPLATHVIPATPAIPATSTIPAPSAIPATSGQPRNPAYARRSGHNMNGTFPQNTRHPCPPCSRIDGNARQNIPGNLDFELEMIRRRLDALERRQEDMQHVLSSIMSSQTTNGVHRAPLASPYMQTLAAQYRTHGNHGSQGYETPRTQQSRPSTSAYHEHRGASRPSSSAYHDHRGASRRPAMRNASRWDHDAFNEDLEDERRRSDAIQDSMLEYERLNPRRRSDAIQDSMLENERLNPRRRSDAIQDSMLENERLNPRRRSDALEDSMLEYERLNPRR